jgi:hypothetical protein
MLTAAECRKLVQSYKRQANEPGLSPRRETLLRNIARSLSGLATQLDMLAVDLDQERRGAQAGSPQ